MNLLAQILSSKVRSGIFRLLFGTEIQELHLMEIQSRLALLVILEGRHGIRSTVTVSHLPGMGGNFHRNI